jgi:tight adherence protein B
MSVLVAAALAGGAAAVLVALPSPGRLRFAALDQNVRRRIAVRGTPAAALLAIPVAVLLGPVLGLLCAVGALVVTRVAAGRVRRRAEAAERAGAVEACAALSAELRAGRDPADALAAAAAVATGPSQRSLRAAAAAARLGGDVPSALCAESGSEVAHVLRALAACWTVCATSGSGLAAAVERLEEGLRGEQAQRRAVDGELAGPRATAALLAVLPAFGLLLAAGLGADPLHVLLETPLGLVCLTLGLALDGLGVLWTDRLVRRAGGTA